MKKIFIFLIGIFIFSGCVPKQRFYTTLTKVEKPNDSGNFKIVNLKDKKYKYEDNYIDIEFLPLTNMIYFKIHNKLQKTIKVLWNDMIIVDEDGYSHSVVPGSVSFKDKNNIQPNISIIRNGYYAEYSVPRDLYVFFPNIGIVVYDFVHINDKTKNIQFLLPLEINNKKQEYLFTFKYDKEIK